MATSSRLKWTWSPRSSNGIAVLLIISSCVTAATQGYDSAMMNALNILPSYTDYFSLTTATLSLNTASVYLGASLSVIYGPAIDYLGRRQAMLWASVLTLIAVIIQAASQNVAMFIVARILIGLGTGASAIAGPTYLAETMSLRWRAWGLGLFNDFWYVGALISAGVTYGTASILSTWAWRIPSILQGLFSIISIMILPFVPESPRWLAYQDRHEEAMEVVSLTYADGDVSNHLAIAAYREIIDTINFEKDEGRQISYKAIAKSPLSRKRVMLACSVGVIGMLSGNNIISYYLGTMLDDAGITNSTTQLEINILLNAFCLVIALIGTHSMNRLGRRTVAISSTVMLIITFFLVGGLTAAYGTSTNTAGIYGTVASIFLFQGSYSFGWTPLSMTYPPEVLNYSIRSRGVALYTLVGNSVALMVTFAFPYALAAIGWKTYMVNATWDVLELLFVIFCWVETKGKTLEEIDEIFDGTKHSDVPDIELILNGKADVMEIQGVEGKGQAAVASNEVLKEE